MNKTYQLIHIDNGQVTMCEKKTIKGEDYYVSDDKINIYNLFIVNDVIHKCIGLHKVYGDIESDNGLCYDITKCKKLIATTNTSLQCPQVVDYVEELAEQATCDDFFTNINEEHRHKLRFIQGYSEHSETHSLSDEESCMFAEYAVKNMFYADENRSLVARTYSELFTLFKSTLPTKVYYR